MTTAAKESGRLAWLTSALSEQKDIVVSLVRRLTSFGSPAGMEESTFAKFLATLEDIAVEKETESEIISRIQAVEERHRLQRRSKKLKPACDNKKDEMPAAYELPVKESGNGWIWLLGALCFMAPRKKNREDECKPE